MRRPVATLQAAPLDLRILQVPPCAADLASLGKLRTHKVRCVLVASGKGETEISIQLPGVCGHHRTTPRGGGNKGTSRRSCAAGPIDQ